MNEMAGTESTGFAEPDTELPLGLPPKTAPEPVDRAEQAWQAYEASIEEPPFDENHYRYHTPAEPLESCPSCLYCGWAEDEDGERRIFLAGWRAALTSLAAELEQRAELVQRSVSKFPLAPGDPVGLLRFAAQRARTMAGESPS